MVERGLYNYPTTCREPERLSDKMWDTIPSQEFACKVYTVVVCGSLRNSSTRKKLITEKVG